MRAMYCPQHVGVQVENNARRAAKSRARSIGFTEIDKGPVDDVSKLRRAMPGYTLYAPDKGQHSREVPIALRKNPLIKASASSIQVSKDLGPGISNDRWMTILTWQFRASKRKTAHINTHWNAAIQDRPTGRLKASARSKAMNNAGRRLEAVIRLLLMQGYDVIVTGDFNYRSDKDASRAWYYSPENIFKRTGLKWHNDGLDWIAWSKGLKKKNIKTIQPGHDGNRSDHPWFIGDFSRNRVR